MNCEKFQTVVSDLARNEIMEAHERVSALAHIAECERCEQAWSDQRELSDGLRNVLREMNSLQAPVELEAKLLAAFRERSRVRPSRVTSYRWRYLVAAAAVLVIAFGVVDWRVQVSSPARTGPTVNMRPGVVVPVETPKHDQSTTVANDSPKQSELPKQRESDRRPGKPSRTSRVNVAKANRPVADPANGLAATQAKEITTDFVALGYASELDLQDGGRLLRVELPRSALARFGLPMNMDRADERVKADLLVGADGLARAIRFVK